MAWVAVNKNGSEKIFDFEPERYEEIWVPRKYTNSVYIPKGTIKKLINKELNWENNPVDNYGTIFLLQIRRNRTDMF